MNVREWAIWQRSRRVVCFLLGMEALALVGFGYAFLVSVAPDARQWIQWAVLTACATLHIQMTQRQEERRRTRTGTVLIDFVGIWVFPAILLLPATLAVLLVALIRAQHWFVARRPPHNFLFSSVSHALAAAIAQVTYSTLGPHDWDSLNLLGSAQEFATLLITALVYEGIQILYVGGVIAMGVFSQRPKPRNILGNPADNLIEAVTIGLGMATAIVLVIMPPAVVVMALASIVFNRLSELGQLQDDVRTDPKTGILNVRGWTESAGRELVRTGKAGGSLAVLMLDLDHFKWINDVYGHPAGDEVLEATAAALEQATRPSDLVGRFGGEEFLILLADADYEAAHTVAERIRNTIAALRINTTDKRGGSTVITGRTVSVGIAVYPTHGETLDTLTQAADAGVYRAKEAGRNRVRVARANTDEDLPRPEHH